MEDEEPPDYIPDLIVREVGSSLGSEEASRLLFSLEGTDKSVTAATTYVLAEGGPPRIICPWRPGRLGVWDSATGRKLGGLRGPGGRVSRRITYEVPPEYRARIAAGYDGGLVCIWSGEDFTTLLTIEAHPHSLVSRLAVYLEPEEGRPRLVSGSIGEGLKIWDGESGLPLLEIHNGSSVTALATFMSADGREARFVVGCRSFSLLLTPSPQLTQVTAPFPLSCQLATASSAC
jgi:WD40 repeat protein